MSEDVSRFLSQVKELGERRIEEDEARSRELEEKILQDRKQRQARRAERARSISPQKSSPANTPPPSSQRANNQPSERLDLEASPALQPPPALQSASSPQGEGTMDFAGPISTSPSKENESPLDAEIKSNYPATPTRSSTTARGLSWQRRPNSQASERSQSRPLSMVATENAARFTNPAAPEPESATESLSKDQIASALSSKDPSWFRQTADRGTNSAAYRKNQVEDPQTVDMTSMRTQLPGMSRNLSSEAPNNEGTPRPDSSVQRNSVTSPTSLSSSLRLDPPSNDAQLDAEPESRGLTSPLGRTSPTRSDRPVSPTKGMGGFVQSAMMKRSDSVSKRWSVQSPAGLQRGDSVASNRNSYASPNRMSVSTKPKPTSLSRETSTDPMRPELSENNKAPSPDVTASSEPPTQESDKVTPPTSPSKTMDPRRWSPQKSSWLESALNKPESPKPKSTAPPPTQPAWMAELQKAKAQKATNTSGDANKVSSVSHKHQVSIGGLMRSSAPGINTAPAGRTGRHNPTSSISQSSGSAFATVPKEPQIPTVPSLQKSNSEPAAEAKPLEKQPPVVKTKPETPPKKDFRANLKPRVQPPAASGGSQEPEFKNVFGHLRKATIQNYVAPDELKNNITRGKAALNLTGGPQKTERRDEFKDAILAKKKEFQAVQSEGRGITRNNSVSSEQPVPEGLLKRSELGRSNTVKRGSVSSEAPGPEARRPSVQSNRISTEKLDRVGPFEKRGSVTETSAASSQRSDAAIEPLVTGQLPVNPSSIGDSAKESSTSNRFAGRPGGSTLANRFNPALAGLLARGPPGSGGNAANAPASTSSGAPTESNDNEAAPGPKLTHMTKNRARGPKRKAPTTSTSTTSLKEAEPSDTNVVQDNKPFAKQAPSPPAQPEVITHIDSSKKRYEATETSRPQPIALNNSAEALATSPGPIPVALKPQKTGNRIHEQVAAFAAQRNQPIVRKGTDETQDSIAQPPSPRKLNMNRMSKFGDIASPIDVESVPEQSKASEPLLEPKGSFNSTTPHEIQTSQPRSPPLYKPKVPLPQPLSLSSRQPSKDELPSRIAEPEANSSSSMGARPLPVPPTTVSARDAVNPPARPLPSPEPKASPIPSPARSPTKQSMDTTLVLKEFFGSNRPQRNYQVDAAEILKHRPSPSPPKIETLSCQLFHFSADAKKLPVPASHERTLFEREMYICSHTLKTESGKKISEVYFWAGDEVSKSTIEDASIFVAREARSLGGTLVKIQQGKETPEFIQALGGIVITQRGSGTKYDSLAPHMLCGRRYKGHVVFDEVDFTPSVLCSGFPYLISQGGRCYLWKGKGSGVDELSCARLIGMDYALSGEVEEVEDGREPATFWDLFGGANRFGSADHWRLKPNYDKYCSRLFLSDAASKQQIVELSQFVQTDLQPTSIYVIDAFFELYIVVGSQAQSQYASFHNALDFAQEYAILAAGMEDRPFVPISTVVLEGIPRDMKSVFRKWRDADSPTITNVNTGLKRGRSLKVVTLNQALQALSD
ncbi:hypothetical protein GGR57DRAFT_349960 [Xylariaceae sp. FL1272]|nr:hypothetical protein GGR57DRAFT_349960 [Xylariaceae sp. FL1272]